MPDSEVKHPGVLTYDPREGFLLEILSEGFESPYVELESFTENSRSASMSGLFVPRDPSTPYDAIYGEVGGKFITLFDVFNGGGSQRHGSQAPHADARYFPQAMVIGAHIPSKSSEVIISLSASVDYLHLWLSDPGGLEVGMETKGDTFPPARDHFARVRFPQPYGPRPGVLLEDGTTLTVDFEGILPGLKWSTFEHESRSSSSASVRFSGVEGKRSFDSFQPKVSALETLLSVCMDRPCNTHAISCEVQFENEPRQHVDVLVPRKGPIPNTETTGKYLNSLALCNDGRRFTDFFKQWFQFYEQNPSIGFLTGFLRRLSSPSLEPSVLMAQTLLEAFHKSQYGKNNGALLPETIEASEKCNPSKNPKEKNRVTAFKRAIDLYFRLPDELRPALIPNAIVWASSLVQARNDIAHEAGLQRREPLEANAAARVTVALITVHVLRHLGIEDKELLQSLNRHNSLSKARKLATDYLQ